MKGIKLKKFQQIRVDEFVTTFREKRELCQLLPQSFSLTSPTGSGKTIMSIAILEELFHPLVSATEGLDDLRVIWFSDSPRLNEQTRRKFVDYSDRINSSKLVKIDNDWTEERLRPGTIHFLNSQLMTVSALLTSKRESRPFTIFDIIGESIRDDPKNVLIFIDEAHRGTGANQPVHRVF